MLDVWVFSKQKMFTQLHTVSHVRFLWNSLGMRHDLTPVPTQRDFVDCCMELFAAKVVECVVAEVLKFHWLATAVILTVLYFLVHTLFISLWAGTCCKLRHYMTDWQTHMSADDRTLSCAHDRLTDSHVNGWQNPSFAHDRLTDSHVNRWQNPFLRTCMCGSKLTQLCGVYKPQEVIVSLIFLVMPVPAIPLCKYQRVDFIPERVDYYT